MIQKDYLIIYHREDNDGVFSAAIFEDYLLNKLHLKLEDLVFLGADYNILSEFAKDNHNTPEKLHEDFKHIIMTDISFNDPKFMKDLYNEFDNDFIWIDHHAPIIKESHKLGFSDCPGIRDTQRSAILNAWKFLYDQFDEAYNKDKKSSDSVPELLRILSAYDSWSYEREGYDFNYVRNVNKGVTVKINLNLHDARLIITDITNKYVRNEYTDFSMKQLIDSFDTYGTILNRYDDIQYKNIIETAGDKSWQIILHDDDRPDHPFIRKCCVIFHQGATNSTMFKSLKNTDISNGIVFKHNPNKTWTISLYNINDDWFHCGEYLKNKYNGGGHKGAAGCQITQEQFIKILKDKII